MSTRKIYVQNNIIDLELSPIYLYLQLWKKFWGLKNEFEIAVVNEPSLFEPLKFYIYIYIYIYILSNNRNLTIVNLLVFFETQAILET